MTDAILSKGLLLVLASLKSWSGNWSNIVFAFWIPSNNSVETNLDKIKYIETWWLINSKVYLSFRSKGKRFHSFFVSNLNNFKDPIISHPQCTLSHKINELQYFCQRSNWMKHSYTATQILCMYKLRNHLHIWLCKLKLGIRQVLQLCPNYVYVNCNNKHLVSSSMVFFLIPMSCCIGGDLK